MTRLAAMLARGERILIAAQAVRELGRQRQMPGAAPCCVVELGQNGALEGRTRLLQPLGQQLFDLLGGAVLQLLRHRESLLGGRRLAQLGLLACLAPDVVEVLLQDGSGGRRSGAGRGRGGQCRCSGGNSREGAVAAGAAAGAAATSAASVSGAVATAGAAIATCCRIAPLPSLPSLTFLSFLPSLPFLLP